MSRKEIMLRIIELNNFFIDEWNKRLGVRQLKKNPLFTRDWLEENFNRFYLVEISKHREENFNVEIQLRYSLRSKEAYQYGTGHQAYYDRYISTISVDLDSLENPEKYKSEVLEEFSSL